MVAHLLNPRLKGEGLQNQWEAFAMFLTGISVTTSVTTCRGYIFGEYNVDGGVVMALVKHLHSPPFISDGESAPN